MVETFLTYFGLAYSFIISLAIMFESYGFDDQHKSEHILSIVFYIIGCLDALASIVIFAVLFVNGGKI